MSPVLCVRLGLVVLMAQKLLNINGREHYVCPASGA